jgi:hypothetical protein
VTTAQRSIGGSVEGTEISGELGVGAIHDLVVKDDGRYAISGEFGTVAVIVERSILRLKEL